MNREQLTEMDPVAPDWHEIRLANTWPDAIDFRSFRGVFRFVKGLFGARKPVCIPDNMPGDLKIPKYVLQEFHNLPNGNYSHHISHGYITGFDISMLGFVDQAREWIADSLEHCQAVADIGTSGGKAAAAIKQRGVAEVWGIDPSPYLLQHAARVYSDIVFIQGLAESLPFSDARLDGISACFVFHEIPPRYMLKALAEFNRVLQVGGRVAISEPSEQQLAPFRLREFLSRKGWLKVYFRFLAQFVFEPFVMAWHQQDKKNVFEQSGFKLVEVLPGMPVNRYLLEKIHSPG